MSHLLTSDRLVNPGNTGCFSLLLHMAFYQNQNGFEKLISHKFSFTLSEPNRAEGRQ